jgi:hypothetical protein
MNINEVINNVRKHYKIPEDRWICPQGLCDDCSDAKYEGRNPDPAFCEEVVAWSRIWSVPKTNTPSSKVKTSTMSILLPEVKKQQERLDRQIARQNQATTREDEVIDWFVRQLKEDNPHIGECFTRPEEYVCYSYGDFIQKVRKEYYPNVPDTVWRFFNFEDMALDLWRHENYYIIYADKNDFVALEDTGKHFPLWDKREEEWFKNHPCKDLFYILRLDV